jgi:hypothetical protein
MKFFLAKQLFKIMGVEIKLVVREVCCSSWNSTDSFGRRAGWANLSPPLAFFRLVYMQEEAGSFLDSLWGVLERAGIHLEVMN